MAAREGVLSRGISHSIRMMQLLPCSAGKLVEDGLAYIRAQHADSGVPSEVQRNLLEEACSPSEIQATANLRGSRLAATEVNGQILVAHAIGQAGELLCLSVLGRTPEGNFQVIGAFHAPHKHVCSSHTSAVCYLTRQWRISLSLH